MSRRESGYECKERDSNETPSWGTGAMILHLRPVLGAGTGNVLSTSQNLRWGWRTTDPGPLSFGPTPPLLANSKTTSDQRINEKWRIYSPPNSSPMSLMLR